MQAIRSIGRMALIGALFIMVFQENGVSQNSNLQRDQSNIAGKWYLTDLASDDAVVPVHRVDFIFYNEGTRYRGAVLLRSGVERPLAGLEFDGTKLRLQMKASTDKSQDEMPWLVADFTNNRFEGYYYNSANAPTGPKLKLVRFPK